MDHSENINGTIEGGNVTSQLIFGALEALSFRKQFDERILLFTALGGKIQFFGIKIWEGMFESVLNREKAEEGDWKRLFGDDPLLKYGEELDIFKNAGDFENVVVVLVALLSKIAGKEHFAISRIVDGEDKELGMNAVVGSGSGLVGRIDELIGHIDRLLL